jgi:hypothetical protein
MTSHTLQRDCFGKEMALSPGETRTVDVREPIDVHCGSGLLWITIEGDSRDFFLRPGQTMNMVMHGRAIIGAERHSTLRIDAAGVRAGDGSRHDVVPLPNPLIFNRPTLART